MLTYREAAPAMKAEPDQSETASHLGEESRCAMTVELQCKLDSAIYSCTHMDVNDTMDNKAIM